MFGSPRFEALVAEKRHGGHEIRRAMEAAKAEAAEDKEPPPVAMELRRPRHGAFFDDEKSTGNITLIEGQTAMMECIVRNVGNKSVSCGVLNSGVRI